MGTNRLDLDVIFDSIWENLELGSKKRSHPFHLCVISTISKSTKDTPDARIVVLREANKEKFTLRSNADLRTNKCNDIEENPNTHLLFYDKEAKIQVRIRAESEIIKDTSLIKNIWLESQEVSQRCYFVPLAPSTEIAEPFNNTMLELDNENLGSNVFCLISTKVKEIDWLELDYNGHKRCKFILNEKGLSKSVWLVP